MNKERRKVRSATQVDFDEILPEYDFSRARPNTYASRYAPPSRAPERKVELQGCVPLDAQAIFRHGFSGENACQAFIAEMDNAAGAP